MSHRGRTVTLVLVLLATACGNGGEEKPQSLFTEVNRPVLGMFPAADIGKDGQPVDPGFTFLPDAPQVTIVAQAGEVTGSPMDLTWFQVTEDGEQELFTHTVEVASFEAAYSVGESPGTLLPGTYRVEATFEGETSSTKFEVEAPDAEAAGTSSGGAEAEGEGATGQGATSGPPASGDSGAVATPVSEVPEGDFSRELWVLWAPIDSDLRTILLSFRIFRETLAGGDWRVEAQATMAGQTRLIDFPMTGQELNKNLDFNPCAHPGGSDLPGTEAEFNVAVYGGNEVIAYGDNVSTVLGPDETKPEVTINSEPPNKSRVEPGDEIVLDATAQEKREPGPITTGPTWQEGINSFKLIAKPGGPVGEEQRSDAGSPQPCGRKQWSLASQATYQVPDDAPPVIEICGEALDFAGNFSDPEACNEYYTGEVWKGTVTGVSIEHAGPCTYPFEGVVTIVVTGDGEATLSAESTSSGTCRGVFGSKSSPFEMSGTKTATGFQFPGPFPGMGPLNIATTENKGSGTSTGFVGPTFEVTLDFDVECTSCE